MFVKLLILSVLFIAFVAISFGIRMLLKPQGKFPEMHISGNKELSKKGITCAQHTDTGCVSTEGFPGCSTCSSRIS